MKIVVFFLRCYRNPYKLDPAGEKLGRTMRAWKVQTEALDPGCFTEPAGFLDSPDCEIIVRGLNGAGPRYIAIARQACFLGWGFSAGPSEMTPEARGVFINAVNYISWFDGQKPLVRRVARGR